MRLAVERAVTRNVLRLPRPVLLRFAGRAPRVVDGQTLDAQLQFGLAVDELRGRVPLHEMTPAAARAHAAASFAIYDVEPEPVASARDWMAAVDDREPVPVRVYTPQRARGGMLVFFHGGGGVIGSVDSYDSICRYLANRIDAVVVSVDYRLAPEHPFPAGIDDAQTAYLWARAYADRLGADPARVAVGGDSMGGKFAALVCQRCKASGAPLPAYQWLMYPGTDLSRSMPSHATFGEGYLLDAATMQWFVDHYLTDTDPRSPAASPLFGENLAGLSPALVLTAGFDPLRDEGLAYADKLAAAGCEVTYRCETGMVHGFLQMGGAFGGARAAIDAAAQTLRSALGAVH